MSTPLAPAMPRAGKGPLSLAEIYAAATGPRSIAFTQRTVAAVAVVAQAVLREAADPKTAPPNAAARTTWALTALASPPETAQAMRWAVVTDDAFSAAGEKMSDDDLLAVVGAFVDALAGA